jgi:hypothetical protein
MMNYELLLAEMMLNGPTWHDNYNGIHIDSVRAALQDVSVMRIVSQTDVKRRAFDKGAQARGGVITGKDTIV